MAPRRRLGGRRGERGFTLVELMYALGYFMIGLAGLTSFQLMAMRGSQQASDITLATNIAANAIENYRLSPPASVLAQPQPMLSTFDRYGTPNGTPTYFTLSATATQPGGAAYYELSVGVRWVMALGDTFSHSIAMQTRVVAP